MPCLCSVNVSVNFSFEVCVALNCLRFMAFGNWLLTLASLLLMSSNITGTTAVLSVYLRFALKANSWPEYIRNPTF